ncbi:hypothetical protein GCK32_021076 [Trichostrongylus colubriformis]|uniref:Uncharacterized protein n=1 Tax=Trichostrongylus colubriformis TaxID=6319 RepID=A0AAN8FZP5_TRICO
MWTGDRRASRRSYCCCATKSNIRITSSCYVVIMKWRI